jgi:hypothetical protein
MMQPDLAKIISGLDQALQDGLTVATKDGVVTLRHFYAGDLIVTSGYIVACDPLLADENTTKPFATLITPGRYPVILSIQHAMKHYQTGYRDYQYVAFATLRLHERRPVRWEPAIVPGEDLSSREDESIPGYIVDSGNGCFMDADIARIFVQRLSTDQDYPMVFDDEMKRRASSRTPAIQRERGHKTEGAEWGTVDPNASAYCRFRSQVETR